MHLSNVVYLFIYNVYSGDAVARALDIYNVCTTDKLATTMIPPTVTRTVTLPGRNFITSFLRCHAADGTEAVRRTGGQACFLLCAMSQ